MKDIDDVVSRLVPLEHYRSPLLPSLRLGRPALVGIASPKASGAVAVSEVPTHWFAIDPGRTALLAFARTDVVTPVADFVPSEVSSDAAAMHPRDAHRLLRQQLPQLEATWFAGAAAPAGVAGDVLAAYGSAVPPRFLPWLQLCCSDFFSWLDTAPQ